MSSSARSLLRIENEEQAQENDEELVTARKELEIAIGRYLRTTCAFFDIHKNVEVSSCRPLLCETKSTDYLFTISQQEVCSQIWNTLFDYPCLQKCPALVDYVHQCAQLSWSLHVQPTRFSIDITTLLFREEWHSRTHTSDPSSSAIRCYLWPTLFQEGICVHRGSVLT